MAQGSFAGSGGLRKVTSIAGKKKKKSKKGKPSFTVNSGLKVKY